MKLAESFWKSLFISRVHNIHQNARVLYETRPIFACCIRATNYNHSTPLAKYARNKQKTNEAQCCHCIYIKRTIIKSVGLQSEYCICSYILQLITQITDITICKNFQYYSCKISARLTITTTTVFQPFSGTTQVSRCQKRTSGLRGARED